MIDHPKLTLAQLYLGFILVWVWLRLESSCLREKPRSVSSSGRRSPSWTSRRRS